jgi:hypothetical protein
MAQKLLLAASTGSTLEILHNKVRDKKQTNRQSNNQAKKGHYLDVGGEGEE